MDEVRGATDKALEKIREAFEVAKERPNKGNMRALELAIRTHRRT
jgi:nitroreductase